MMRLASLTIILAMVSPAATLAQTTPWGDPDIQGIWSLGLPSILTGARAAEK